MEKTHIRLAEEPDVAPVAEIYQRILAQEGTQLSRTGWLPGVYPVESTARRAWEKGELFVYERGGTVLAAAILNQTQVDAYRNGNWRYPARDSQVMVLHTLVVDPQAAEQGIGRAFVGFYEAYARSKGCQILRLDTNEKNLAARRLYRLLGYEEAGIVPCEFNGIPDVQLVLLEKRLEPAGAGE